MAQSVRTILFGDHDPYAGLELLPVNEHGWNSGLAPYIDWVNELKPALVVEVGTWMGRSAINMAKHLKTMGHEFEIVCIDTFCGSVEHWDRSSFVMDLKNGRPTIYEQFLSNVVHAGLQDVITPFPVDSRNGGLLLREFGVKADIVYIDAGHDELSVTSDLVNYSHVVRDAGILVGDDYHHPDVIKAAMKTFGPEKVIDRQSKFIWIK